MLRVNDPCRRLVVIELPGRGRNFREINNARASSCSFSLSPFPLSDAAQRDAMPHVCINAKGRCIRTAAGPATYFCRTPSRSPLAYSVPPLRPSAIPYILPSRLLARLRSVLYPRGGRSLSFLSLILYSLSFISRSA